LVESSTVKLVFEFVLGLVAGAIALWWVAAEMIEDWCRRRVQEEEPMKRKIWDVEPRPNGRWAVQREGTLERTAFTIGSPRQSPGLGSSARTPLRTGRLG
jgi:hypothetical protein